MLTTLMPIVVWITCILYMLDKTELKSRIRSDTYSQIKGLDDILKSVIIILVWLNFFKCMQTKR